MNRFLLVYAQEQKNLLLSFSKIAECSYKQRT